MKWQELATTSHYETAIAVRQEMLRGNLAEATTGIEELIEALSRSDKRALRSQLIRLMSHVIKWKTQPEQRSRSWAVTIENARIEIEEILELEPSLQASIPVLLKDLFEKARRVAELEMNQKTAITVLSQREVFEQEYVL